MKVGEAYVDLKAKTDSLSKGLKKAEGETKKSTQQMGKAFGALSSTIAKVGVALGAAFAVTKAVQGIKSAITLANEQERVEQRLASVVRATGEASGFTAKQLYEQAAAMQEVTRYGDEAVISAQAVAASFVHLNGEVFTRTVQLAGDVAEVMGTDLKSATLQLAKAVNDPVTQLSYLNRAGITFDKTQKDLIKTLYESGRQFEAQSIVLDTVAEQYGGAATAAANNFGGALDRLSNYWGDLLEQIGFVITKNPILVRQVKDLTQYIIDLTGEIEEWRKANETLIADKVITFIKNTKSAIEGFVTSAKKIWDIINYDPAILEFGLIGLLLGGKKFALVLGLAAHLAKITTLNKEAAELAKKGMIDILEYSKLSYEARKNLVESIQGQLNIVDEHELRKLGLLKVDLDEVKKTTKGAKKETDDLGGSVTALTDKEKDFIQLNKQIKELENSLRIAGGAGVDLGEKLKNLTVGDYGLLGDNGEITGLDPWVNHIKKMEELKGQVQSTSKEFDFFKDTVTTVGDGVGDAVTDWILGVESFADAWKKAAASIVGDLVKIAVQQLIVKNLVSAVGEWFPSAKGTAFYNGNIVPMAQGGLINGPTILAGERGTEAIMPLGRTSSGDLGIKVAGGTAPNVEVNIINNTGGQIEETQSPLSFNGENWVLDVVLNAYGTNKKGFRDIIQSRQ